MIERRIKTTAVERAILNSRFNAAVEAARVARAQQDIAIDVFTMFCEKHGLPDQADFVRIDGDELVVSVPEPKPSETPPKS